MAKIISISTKKGDAGESFLADGSKLPKDDLVFEVLGTIDELNSHIGAVVAQLKATIITEKKSVIENLEDVQSNLYLLSGILAKAPKLNFSKTKLTKVEKLGDELQTSMSDGWTTKFLYPGGSIIGAQLDVTRSVCRRCERLLVHYTKQEKVRPVVLQYINRLSDFLFILRCYVNLKFGVKEKQFSK
jgi:cob(I)alamin adenosyltransferase